MNNKSKFILNLATFNFSFCAAIFAFILGMKAFIDGNLGRVIIQLICALLQVHLAYFSAKSMTKHIVID